MAHPLMRNRYFTRTSVLYDGLVHQIPIKINMKNRSISFLVIITILILACNSLIGPTPTPAPPTQPAILHFENDFITFDYPEGMKVFEAADPAFTPYPENIMGGQLVAGLADPQEMDNWGHFLRTVSIFRHSNPSGSGLEQFMETAYVPVHNIKVAHIEWVVDASGPVTLAGLPAFQQTYRYLSSSETPPYEMRDIWAEKDGTLFRVSIWTAFHNPQAFAAFQSLADKILASLVIKENLPPLVETPTQEPKPSPTPFPTSMIAHFENDMVAFDYLKPMKVYIANNPAFNCYPDFQLSGELIVGMGDPNFTSFDKYYRSIRIFREKMPAGSNLEAIMLDAYRQAEKKFPHEKGVVDPSGPIAVDGLLAVQRTYRVYSGEPAYEMRDVWIQRDNEIFIIAIWTEYTNPEDFAVFQAGANMFLKSLRIKK